MYFRINQIKPYAIGNIVYKGKIIDIDYKNKTYTIEDLETKEIHIVSEKLVFIGDD